MSTCDPFVRLKMWCVLVLLYTVVKALEIVGVVVTVTVVPSLLVSFCLPINLSASETEAEQQQQGDVPVIELYWGHGLL